MEPLFFPARSTTLLLLLSFSISFFIVSPARADDPEALLALKSSIDPSNVLPWPQGADFCRWQGVKECVGGRVTKLVIEFRNLSGGLEGRSLNQLNQLRVLSFKSNSLAGAMPDISGLTNLKSLYLSDNHFSGDFPASIASLHRLKVVVLSSNRISGHIPAALLSLVRLYTLFLQDNELTGEIPPLNQSSLRYFNVSGNRLSGRIPATPALVRFNLSSFSGNRELCGEQVARPCSDSGSAPPAPTLSPGGPATIQPSEKKEKKTKLVIILASSIGGSLLLLAFAVVFATALLCFTRRRRRRAAAVAGAAGVEKAEGGDGQAKAVPPPSPPAAGRLVWCGGVEQGYSVEDLLRASAETLGRGTTGSTYKAVMESGFIVTVKRLKEVAGVGMEEFGRQVEELGRLRQPNLVPLRAFFQAKDERLLVYDYFPNGNLFSLVHGSKPAGGGKPLHWTSCLKIAEDLAAGLVHLHEAGLVHGNLKSSNVLLGSDFESCLTDYGLHVLRSPEDTEEGATSATALFYRAPECRHPSKPPTQKSDVYSFGVLLVELLTGKTPFPDLIQEPGPEIVSWVRSVREEEGDSGDDPSSGNEASEEKLNSLLNIAISCVSPAAGSRPAIKEVLKMIRETRGETHVSSNSSDHSPGRWSDTVQSLPDYTERD